MAFFGILFSVLIVGLLPAVTTTCVAETFRGRPEKVRLMVRAFTAVLISEVVGGTMAWRLFYLTGDDGILWAMGWVFLLVVSLALPIGTISYYMDKRPDRG